MIITQENIYQYMEKIMKKLTTLLLILLFLTLNSAYAKKNKPQTYEKQTGYLNMVWWDGFDDPILHEYMLTLFKPYCIKKSGTPWSGCKSCKKRPVTKVYTFWSIWI